jgi:DNA repair protein RecN (Recombination protein N)
MLKQLNIQNYALIDELDISFSDGLTIITGETGAGKSILLGALSLIIGQRADTGSLQDKTRKCIVEGTFSIKGYKLNTFFKQNEIDYSDETIVRREINPEGKSRAFINDTPVILSLLRELGERLIDIHSQHETLTLNDSAFQLELVDVYAGHEQLLNAYQSEYKKFKQQQQILNGLVEREAQAKKDLDYFQFQFNELEDANLKAGEQIAMEQELETLNNAEEIKGSLSKAHIALDGGERNIVVSLNEVKVMVSNMAKYNTSINDLSGRLNSTLIELKDIANEIESLEQGVNYDPKRIEALNLRVDTIYRLQKKHNVNAVEDLLDIKEELSKKLIDISSLETEIVKLKKELADIEKSLRQQADKLSANRQGAIPKIEKEIKKTLSELGMPNADLKITRTALTNNDLNSTGIDNINYLFSANKGSELKQLHKVASGGELSRLMLSLKALIAQLTSLPAIIFDEIDTGVSGEVANKVGVIMAKMAEAMQVITITHLPQIASKGSSHLFVYKEEKNKKTYTQIKKLDKNERVIEIAKMLSNQNPSDAAIKNAKELLKA